MVAVDFTLTLRMMEVGRLALIKQNIGFAFRDATAIDGVNPRVVEQEPLSGAWMDGSSSVVAPGCVSHVVDDAHKGVLGFHTSCGR